MTKQSRPVTITDLLTTEQRIADLQDVSAGTEKAKKIAAEYSSSMPMLLDALKHYADIESIRALEYYFDMLNDEDADDEDL